MAIGTPKKITLDLYINKHVFTRVSQYDIDSRQIIIQITDNGKGMDKELLENVLNNMYVENIDKSKKGYGLRNVCKRLKYY